MARTFQKRGAWWIDFTDSTGRRHREPIGAGASHILAKQVLAKRLTEAAERQHFPARAANSKRFEEVSAKFWELHGQKMRSTTWVYMLKRVKSTFGPMRVGDISSADIQRFYNEIASKRTNSTANRYLTLIRMVFNKAKHWGDFYGENPCAGVKRGREAAHRLRYLTYPEIQRLLSMVNPRLAPIIVCALLSGMRRGEILGLTWDNIDLTHGRLYILQSKSGQPRELPLSGKLLELFASLNPKAAGPVFDLPLIMLRRYFASAITDAKITGFRFHDLRHSYASHFVMSGGDLLTLSKLLGHSTTAMTQRYAHLSSNYLASKVAAFEARLPIQMEDLSLGWHQGRHQAPQAIPDEPKLLLYNQP